MGLITLVQGFKLSTAKFDDFLVANGLPTIEGCQPWADEAADIAKLFKAKGVDCEVRVFVPRVTGFNRSKFLFVCCDWIHVLAAREIEGELQKPVPPAFEDMRRLLQAESVVSKYIVYNEDRTWTPEELIRRNTAPVQCGFCDAAFSSWLDRMRHREDEHGISEDQNPLPDC